MKPPEQRGPDTLIALSEVRDPVHDDLEDVSARMARVLRNGAPLIRDVNGHLLRMRGKMFRPTLLLLASRVRGRRPPERVRLAGVIELIHLATLVHDDAIDESHLRRGLPTVNVTWSHKVSVIMGDYLYSRAMAEIAASGDLALIAMAAEVTNSMTVGEMMQIAGGAALDAGEEPYFTLIERKTASLIATACAMGAHVGSPEDATELTRFGHDLGMAFQIADDLLDLCGDEELMGKRPRSDLRELKATLPIIHAFRTAGSGDRERLRAAFDSDGLGDGDEEWLVELAVESGGIDYARAAAQRYAGSALEALADIPSSDESKALQAAVGYVLQRER
ncbi:MAG: polyprenyl synthetase family protein [Gemmatimonadetes bacterium]|nr:polyprenyl synthetase family protein [Gemmatimonadota bacterium]